MGVIERAQAGREPLGRRPYPIGDDVDKAGPGLGRPRRDQIAHTTRIRPDKPHLVLQVKGIIVGTVMGYDHLRVGRPVFQDADQARLECGQVASDRDKNGDVRQQGEFRHGRTFARITTESGRATFALGFTSLLYSEYLAGRVETIDPQSAK